MQLVETDHHKAHKEDEVHQGHASQAEGAPVVCPRRSLAACKPALGCSGCRAQSKAPTQGLSQPGRSLAPLLRLALESTACLLLQPPLTTARDREGSEPHGPCKLSSHCCRLVWMQLAFCQAPAPELMYCWMLEGLLAD